MDYIQLQNSDMKMSKLSLGTWVFSGAKVWGDSDEVESIRTISTAIDAGINFFDSAAKYGDGRAEQVLGKAVKSGRDKVHIATKVPATHMKYGEVITECERSLSLLGMDYIDLYQVHWPVREIPFDETMGAFEKLKKDGKIRAIGVCNHGVRCIEGVKQHHAVTNQLPYSLIWRQVEDEIVPASVNSGMAVWAYCPLAQGLLSGKFRSIDDVPMHRRETRFYSGKWRQGRHDDTGFEKEIFSFLSKLQAIVDKTGIAMNALALAFLKSRSDVGSILIGSRNKEQLQQNLSAYNTVVPDEILAEVVALSDELKPKMGTNPDLWINADGGRTY